MNSLQRIFWAFCFLVLNWNICFAESVLSQADADSRFKLISDVHYSLKFQFDLQAPIAGKIFSTFQILSLPSEAGALRLDFQKPESISELHLNGIAVEAEVLKAWIRAETVMIPYSRLHTGRNEIVASFVPEISKDGSGLNAFRDGSDTYYYTDFQPFYAHRLFPCFDQPDLKATFQLEVDAPAQWVIASAVRESQVTKEVSGKSRWLFPLSERIAVYAFSLFAGPFLIFDGPSVPVPMRVLVRKSQRSAVPAQKIFDWTGGAIKWMANYLSVSFPFSKYDQIFVPGYHSSGMENVGATTLSEEFLLNAGTHAENMKDLMATIFHEVVHSWFGNLVTYKWWNGLWLHEGLANIFSMMLMDEVGGNRSARQYFYTYLHSAAEETDIGPTARGLEMAVPHTDIAEEYFDHVTYGKSATVLSQLFSQMGTAQVRDTLRAYVSRFQWGSPQPEQFFEIFERAAGQVDPRFSQWRNSWLKRAGINQLKVHLECTYAGSSLGSELVVKSLVLEQMTSKKQGPLRSHNVKVGLMNWSRNAKSFEVSRTVQVQLRGARTVVREAEGTKCPDAVDPNVAGLAYVREQLDARSQSALLLAAGKIPDPLQRQRAWKMLWDQVRLGELPAVDYLKSAILFLPRETDFYVLTQLLGTTFNGDLSKPTAIAMIPLDLREDIWKGFESALLESLRNSALPAQGAAVIVEALVDAAVSREMIGALRNVLQSGNGFKGVWFSSSLKWKALSSLSRSGEVSLDGIAKNNFLRDVSAEASLNFGIYNSSSMSRSIKQRIWKAALDEDAEDEETLGSWKAFHWIGHDELNRPYGPAFFRALPGWLAENNLSLLLEKIQRLYPSGCNPEQVAMHGVILRSGLDIPPKAKGLLAAKLQQAKICFSQRSRKIPTQEPGSKLKPGAEGSL